MKTINNWIMPICILVMLLVSAMLYPSLPEQMPSKWSYSGEIMEYQHKALVVLVIPVIAIGLSILTYVIPYIDPRKEQYVKFEKSYYRMRLATVVFLAGLHIVILTHYDEPDAITRMMLFSLGLLLAFLGNELGRIRQTWFVGIRTPWTLSDERVWQKTHRVGARYFVAVGILNMVMALTLPLPIAFAIFMIVVLAVVGGLFYYSYSLYQQYNHV